MPTADQAVKRTNFEIENARRLGVKCVKIVHGYGSHGKGGKIRVEVRAYLERMKRQGASRTTYPGSAFPSLTRPPAQPLPGAANCARTATSSAQITA